MKTITAILFAMLLVLPLTGCTETDDYTSRLTSAPKQAKNAQLQANQMGLQQAANSFKAMNGRYPGSIEELKQASGMDVDISNFNYDPATGQVIIRQ